MGTPQPETGPLNNGTSCADCAVCCFALRIDEFGKQPGVWCQHCTGHGCGIYEHRYDICEKFLCGFRLLPSLAPAWRPDRSGIMIIIMGPEEMPEEYRPQGHGMHFMILGGEKAIARPGFVEYISTLVSRNVAVYVSADSPKTIINPYLRKLVADKNKAGVQAMISHIYQQHLKLREINNWQPLPWVHLP